MDFIPLKRKRSSSTPSMPKKKQQRTNYAFGGDHRLIPRLKQLVSEQRYSKNLDVDILLSDLLETYPEYKRKKKNTLKFAIQRVQQLHASDHGGSDSSEEEIPESFADVDLSTSNKKYVAYQDTNLMNKAITDLYKNAQREKEADSHRSHHALVNAHNSKVVVPEEKIGDENAPNALTHLNSELKKVKSNAQNIKKSPESNVPVVGKSNVTFADVGGIDNTLMGICEIVSDLVHPGTCKNIGVDPVRGILLHGPPGCGKTLIAHAIAGVSKLALIEVAAPELVSGISGESESKIREVFSRAITNAPSILFIDEIDSISSKRELAQKEMEKRMVSQLSICMDDLNSKVPSPQVLVIGATTRLEVLDPALRRAGRFEEEISVGIPNEKARLSILQKVCKNIRFDPDFNFEWLAKNTPGYVGSDLKAIVRKAARFAMKRSLLRRTPHFTENTPIDLSIVEQWIKKNALLEDDPEQLVLNTSHFQSALDIYQPSTKKEGFATIPNVSWEDIGGLKEARKALETAILLPIKRRDEFEKCHLSRLSGILLCGPKGCGKTLLAKAVANECNINFLSVKGPELLSMYVGESEKAVRQCFQRARNSAPCVIFFDEIDALCPSRSRHSENAVADRVVNQLLTEIDGMGPKSEIFVMGATNRPEIIDSAMLRPGRLERVIHINLPSPEGRIEILKAITKDGTQPMFSCDVNLESVALDSRCEGFSGADLASLVREASYIAFVAYDPEKETFKISPSDIEAAFSKTKSSVSKKEKKSYDEIGSDLVVI